MITSIYVWVRPSKDVFNSSETFRIGKLDGPIPSSTLSVSLLSDTSTILGTVVTRDNQFIFNPLWPQFGDFVLEALDNLPILASTILNNKRTREESNDLVSFAATIYSNLTRNQKKRLSDHIHNLTAALSANLYFNPLLHGGISVMAPAYLSTFGLTVPPIPIPPVTGPITGPVGTGSSIGGGSVVGGGTVAGTTGATLGATGGLLTIITLILINGGLEAAKSAARAAMKDRIGKILINILDNGLKQLIRLKIARLLEYKFELEIAFANNPKILECIKKCLKEAEEKIIEVLRTHFQQIMFSQTFDRNELNDDLGEVFHKLFRCLRECGVDESQASMVTSDLWHLIKASDLWNVIENLPYLLAGSFLPPDSEPFTPNIDPDKEREILKKYGRAFPGRHRSGGFGYEEFPPDFEDDSTTDPDDLFIDPLLDMNDWDCPELMQRYSALKVYLERLMVERADLLRSIQSDLRSNDPIIYDRGLRRLEGFDQLKYLINQIIFATRNVLSYISAIPCKDFDLNSLDEINIFLHEQRIENTDDPTVVMTDSGPRRLRPSRPWRE